MNRIEIVGRLKENVNVNGKKFICKDVNLDSDFIIDFAKEIMQKLGYTLESKKIQYEKFFDDEKIMRVEFDINYSGNDYGIAITRNTFNDKILVGCEIIAKKDNIELFGSTYELKVKVIEVYNRICDNSNIFFLEDYNNERICQSAYLEIYRVETRFRNILTRYLMKKYGRLVLSQSLKGEVDKYSKWFRKGTAGKYKTFKRINTDYCNLDFTTLPKILNLRSSQIINQEGACASAGVEQLKELLKDEADISDIYKQILKVQELICKRRYIFDDKPTEEERADAIRVWGTAEVIEREDLRDILDDDFLTLWEEELSKMRNMVAHNKPICRELYYDIIETCEKADKKFDKCIEFIESYFYPDEEGVFSALEEMACREEQYESNYIENERELAGIEMPLSKDLIETMIIEDLKTIQQFMDIIYNLDDMRNVMEEIACFIDEFSGIDDEVYNEEFKYEIFSIIKSELNLDDDFNMVKEMPAYEIVTSFLFSGINIEKAIEFYMDDTKYPSWTYKFECFSMDYDVEWYGIDNKEYRIAFDGTLEPENGNIDILQFKFYINKDEIKTYDIEINYGDYTVPSASYIDDEQVNYLIEDIDNSIMSTVNVFKKIHDISTKLMDLI